MKNKTSDIIMPYRIYGPDGKLELTSDERCRYAPATEMSLLKTGHTIKLGTRNITKKEVVEMLRK